MRSRRKKPAKRKPSRRKAPKAHGRHRTPEARKKAAVKRRKDAERAAYLKRARRLGYQIAQFKEPPKKIVPLDRIPPADFNEIEAYHVGALSVHQSLAEATEALNRVRNDEANKPMRRMAFTTGLTLGLSIVAVLGVGLVLAYVLFRRKDDNQTTTIMQAPPQVIQLRETPRRQIIDVRDKEPDLPEYLGDEEPIDVSAIEAQDINPIESIANAVTSALRRERENRAEMRTFMQSFSLPYIGDPTTESIRVATAGELPFEVVVRCVEPPGGHAILAFDPNELNIPGGLPFTQTVGTAYSTFPVGNVLPIPAGQFQIIRLRPRQALYAKGTVAIGGANQSTATAGVILEVTSADFVSGISW